MPIRRPSRRNPHTFLIHLFGRGLDGERYLVERYRAKPDGEIRPVREEQLEGRRGPRRTVVGAGAVREMRPERDEIIVCTALDLKPESTGIGQVRATIGCAQAVTHAHRAPSPDRATAPRNRYGPRTGTSPMTGRTTGARTLT